MVSKAKAVAALVCETSNSGFKSRQTPLEDAAKWLATGLENQGTGNCRGSIPPSSVFLKDTVGRWDLRVPSSPLFF